MTDAEAEYLAGALLLSFALVTTIIVVVSRLSVEYVALSIALWGCGTLLRMEEIRA